MAGPITWRNVSPVDSSSNVNAYLRAGAQLGQGISGFGEAVGGFVDDRVQAQTDMMTGELLNAGDDINAANAIVQKYAAGQFAPTAESIQRAQTELRSIAEFNSGQELDLLNKSRINQQIGIAASTEDRAQKQALTDEEQRLIENDRAAAELRLRQADNARAAQRRAEEANAAGDADRLRERNLTQIQTEDKNTALIDDVLMRARLNPNDPTVLQDISKLGTQNLTTQQIARLNTTGAELAQANYALPPDVIAPFIQRDKDTGQIITNSSGQPMFGVSDLTGVTPERLASLEDSQIRGIQKQFLVTEDQAKRIWKTTADASGWTTFKNQVGKVKEVAQADSERQAAFTANLKTAGSPEMAILLDVAGVANKEALQWEDSKRGAFANELNGLLTNIAQNPVFSTMSATDQYEFARRIMNKANYWSTLLGVDGFSIAGDNAFIDTDIKDLDPTQLYDEYKKAYASESNPELKKKANEVMKSIEEQQSK